MVVDSNDVGFFEGAEKLLEIWFEGNEDGNNDGKADLRLIPRCELDALLKLINAEIISFVQNEEIDSYILSESSMFISHNRFIIKTCGIIKLLFSVKPIIQLASDYGNMTRVTNFFYSRRVFLRPDEQIGIHKTFKEEVAFLDDIIVDGSAYVLGRVASEQWYLYTMDNVSPGTSPSDVTLEVLMSELDHDVMAQFSKFSFASSEELINETGISRLIPGSVNDGLLFDPVGYSMNGLNGASYYTIHVTPQDICSYVSFETNLVQEDYSSLISKVVTTFRPGKFIITFFSAQGAPCGGAGKAMERIAVEGYRCADQHHEKLKNYSVAYQYHHIER